MSDQESVSTQEAEERALEKAEAKQEIEHDDKPSTPTLCLTDEQTQAVELILEWVRGESRPLQVSWQSLEENTRTATEFKLGGYAGTGKTTIIKTILNALQSEGKYLARVSAFTGKAVNVLKRKGVSAQTLHSLMYNVEVDSKTGAVTFYKRSSLAGNPDLVIVDESSMVSLDLLTDLRSFGTKILWVGDPGQLEPVGNNPDLMASPDLVLSKIHRQAESSPIITLANKVRQGCPLVHPFPDRPHEGGLDILAKGQVSDAEMVTFDQVICARNKTRTAFNDRMRIALGRAGTSHLVVGEKLIVLKNNRNFGVFNGQLLWVEELLETSTADTHWMVMAKDEEGTVHKLPIWKGPFFDPRLREAKDLFIPQLTENGRTVRKEGSFRGLQVVYADYGYCITCHKSQGSEWDKVLVYDEVMPPKVWDMRRWRYTAITRAAKELTYLL